MLEKKQPISFFSGDGDQNLDTTPGIFSPCSVLFTADAFSRVVAKWRHLLKLILSGALRKAWFCPLSSK